MRASKQDCRALQVNDIRSCVREARFASLWLGCCVFLCEFRHEWRASEVDVRDLINKSRWLLESLVYIWSKLCDICASLERYIFCAVFTWQLLCFVNYTFSVAVECKYGRKQWSHGLRVSWTRTLEYFTNGAAEPIYSWKRVSVFFAWRRLP